MRKILLSVVLSAAAAMQVCAAEWSETGWFDARISDYGNILENGWPTDGSVVPVQGVGVWTNTEFATLSAEADGQKTNLVIESPESSGPFFMAARQLSNIADGSRVTVAAKVVFPAGEWLPELEPGVKGSLSVLSDTASGETNYYGVVKGAESGNEWVKLDGAAPVPDEEVEVAISLWRDGGKYHVSYSVGGVNLSHGDATEFEIEIPEGMEAVEGASFTGSGEVGALWANVRELVQEPVFLTLPAKENITIASVSVAGVDIPLVDGKYSVPAGSVVTVVFKPAAGYAIGGTASTVTYVVFDDLTLAAEDMPDAINVAQNLTINEIMAKNGVSLVSAAGKSELDWVELHNSGDNDINLAGWYLFDDPSKAQSKWAKIQGSCIVPAHGYKIVFADKDFTGTANEAWTAIGLSTGGESLFLADPDGNVIHRVDFPAQMEDISYGLGNIERTVLSAHDAAQYRVGEGEWHSITGSVGMCGTVGGFTVTAYQMNKDNTANIDKVLAAIAANKYTKKTVTENVQTIAFQQDGSQTTFQPYAAFSTLGVSGNYFAVVVEGSVYIPRAGSWTFSVGSDDGYTLEVFNDRHSYSSEYSGPRGYGQSPSAFHFPEPGAYNVKLVYFQVTGAATLDFSVAEGDHTDYEGADEEFSTEHYKLVGSAESGVTHAGRWAAYSSNDVTDEMKDVSKTLEWKSTFVLPDAPSAGDTCKLNIRYADGFTARVNGTQIATVAAASKRSLAQALAPASFEFPYSLLAKGENTIEVTVENDAIGDNELFLSPEISIKKGDPEYVYFKKSTPGAANTTAGKGAFTPKVAFSVPHGWKTEPFEVSLSCAEAPNSPIYYTLDGTSPTTASYLYTGPISVSRTTCIRAAVPQSDAIMQMDSSATYLFAQDVIRQDRATVPAGFPASGAINSQVMRFGLDQTYVNGDTARVLDGFTNEIATLSLVIDPKNLFDSSSGIYVNPTGDGRAWERATMVEQIDPVNGESNEFSSGAGLRIRGAFSRNVKYPKHSLRLLFRPEYGGENKLEFPLFGDEGTGKFKKVDLRTSQNYAWSNGQTGDTFVHDVFSRDSQRDMGEHYARSRYYHLFINGQYWGLYQTEERGDDNFAESYNGGDADNYDVIKTSQPGYVTGATEGNAEAWEALWNIAVNEGFTGAYASNYKKAMGLNPDGSRNPEYPIYLNPTNLAVYMLVSHYTCDSDCPASTGDKNKAMPNNIYALRNRIDGDGKSDGFFFLRHDAEHSMGVNKDRAKYSSDPTQYGNELWNANFKNKSAFNPSELNYTLAGNKAGGKEGNPEYKMLLADLFYKHCLKPGGALTAEKSRARFESRMAEIENSIACEIARWRTGSSVTYSTWTSACNNSLAFIENRTSYMLSQYRNRGWYPSIDAPAAFDAEGNRIGVETVLEDSAVVKLKSSVPANEYDGGVVYYTLDGSDPRAAGGAVADGALVCGAEGIILPRGGATVTARYLSGSGEWSAIDNLVVKYAMPQAEVKDALRVAEALTAALGGDDTLDYLVVTNISSNSEIQLGGVKIVAWNAKKKTEAEPSLTYTFQEGVSLMPGASLKIGSSEFPASGKLTNSQVGLRVYDAEETLVQDVYLDVGWWNGACDEKGPHFIAKTFGAEAKTHSDWKPSETDFGANLRVLEMYTSTTDGGDSGEFIVLTNLDASAAIDLTDVKLVAWNSKKKSEADPSLVITLDAVTIPAGGTVVLDQATYFGTGKLTNSKVGLKIYDPAEACAQEVEVDAGWWNGACDGKGEHFVALEFGETVKTESQWTHRAPAPADWPDDPETEITETTTPADLGITDGAFTNAAPQELIKLAKWAKENSVPYAGEVVNAMSFDENGNPATAFEEAYLLNCAVDEVEEKKAEFKFESIVPGVVPSIEGDFNGVVHIFGAATLEGDIIWSENEEAKASARFFKAELKFR